MHFDVGVISTVIQAVDFILEPFKELFLYTFNGNDNRILLSSVFDGIQRFSLVDG